MKSRSKGIVLSYVYTVSNSVIGLFMSAYVLRMLGKTEYGIYQTMASFLTYLVLFEFGTGTIMTRNISLCKKDETESFLIQKNVSTIWSIALVLSFLIISTSLLFYLSIDSIYDHSMTSEQRAYGKIIFLICVIKLVFGFYVQTMNGILLGFEHYSIRSVVSLVTLFLRTGIVVVLLAYKRSALLLVTIDAFMSLGTFLYVYIYCRSKFGVRFNLKHFDKLIFQQMLPLAFAMFLQTIVNMANNNVDKFVIGILISPEAVAVYSIGMYIYTTFSSLTTIPISMYMPQIARDMREGKAGEELTKTLISPCRLIVLSGGFIMFGFIAVGRPFISIFYGMDYSEAWLIAVIVMIPMFINMSNGVLINVLDVLRKRHVRSIYLGITAVGNIILTVWWIKIWGMVGAALATAICTLIGQILLMNIYYQKKIKINVMLLFREAYKGLIPGLILSCIISALITYLINSQYMALIIGGAAFCTTELVTILTLKDNINEKQLIVRTIQRFNFLVKAE